MSNESVTTTSREWVGGSFLHWSYDRNSKTFHVWDSEHNAIIAEEIMEDMHRLVHPENSKETENQFKIGSTALEALGDRVLVLVDPFRSGYECRACEGRGYSMCDECNGGKSKLNPQITCKSCHGQLKISCSDCNGTGVEKGGLILPDQVKNRPRTGTIVSCGRDVGRGVQRLFGAVRVQTSEERSDPLKVGDKVIFGGFAGHDIELNTTDGKELELRILNESEVLTRVHGEGMSLRRIGKGSKEEVL